MIRPPPSCTLTDTLFPYKTLCRSRSWWWGGGTKATWGGHVDDDGCDSAGSGAQVAVIGDPASGSRPLQDVHDAHGAGPGHVAQPGPGAPDLPLPRGPPQLEHGLLDLRQARPDPPGAPGGPPAHRAD